MDQREKRKQENNNSLQNESKRSKPNGFIMNYSNASPNTGSNMNNINSNSNASPNSGSNARPSVNSLTESFGKFRIKTQYNSLKNENKQIKTTE